MAESAKGKTYSGTGQTFEETFKGTQKGTAEYQKALEALAKEYARLNDLSDTQRQWLEDYLKGLDNISDAWEKINDYVQDITETFDDFSEELKDVRSAFTNIVKDLTSARQRGTETVTLFRNLRDISGDLERSLQVQGGFSESNLRSIERRAQKTREIYEYGIKSLTGGRLDKEAMAQAAQATKTRLDDLKESLQMQMQLARVRAERLGLSGDKASERAKLTWYKMHGDEVRKLTGDLERLNYTNYQHVLNLEKEASAYKKLGQEIRREHPGLGFAAKLAEKFGVSGAKEQLDEWVREQAAAKKEGRASEDPTGMKMISGWAKDAITLTGILTALGLTVKGIVAAFKDVSSEAAKLKQNIGTWQFSAAAANTEFASSVQWLQTANEIAQQFGQDPTSFISPEGIARLAEAKNLLGLSAEQAGNLGIRAKIAGQNTDNYNEALVQGINHGNAMNRSAVAHGIALKEALSTSDDLVLSLGNSGERLGRAVVAAKNLGMTLKDVDSIAAQLLNFESSIESEMQAQLLVGQQMNLSRARAYALQNDLENVAKELTRQNMDAAKFGNLNRIQQESFAKALGMSREQLGRMLVQQEGLTKLTDAQVKAATGMTREQLEAMGITERWKVATDKLVQAFTPILEAIMPVVEGLSKLITGIAGGIGKIFGGLNEGMGPVIKGLLVLTGTILTTRVAFRLLGLAGKKAFAGLGVGIAKTLRGVGIGIRGLITSVTPLATGGVGWAAVGMVLALGGAAWMLGKGIQLAAVGFKTLGETIKSLSGSDAAKILQLGVALVGLGIGLKTLASPLALAGAAVLRISSGAIKAVAGSVTPEGEGTVSTAVIAATEERIEKLVAGISNRLNDTLNVHVDNLDGAALNRLIALEATNFR